MEPTRPRNGVFPDAAWAHEAAVAVGGKTIAVMPCGINLVHPVGQEKLYEDILKKGGLIKKYFNLNFKKTTYIIIILLSAISCRNENLVFIDFEDLNGSWMRSNELNFSFESSDNSILDFSLALRTDSTYPFSNIFIVSTIKNNNYVISDTLE